MASCRSREHALFGEPSGFAPRPLVVGQLESASFGLMPFGGQLEPALTSLVPISTSTSPAQELRRRFARHTEGKQPDALAKHRLINHPVARNRLAALPPATTLRVVVPPAPGDRRDRLVVAVHNAGRVTVLDLIEAVVDGCVCSPTRS